MSDMNWSYLAGFTDGDGTIGMYGLRPGGDVRVAWEQAEANVWVLVEIAEFLEKHEISYKTYECRKNGRVYHRIRVHRRDDVIFLLTMLTPHLILKKEIATKVLEAQSNIVWGSDETCPYGHEWTDENTYIEPSGSKTCRTCRRGRMRDRRAALKGGG